MRMLVWLAAIALADPTGQSPNDPRLEVVRPLKALLSGDVTGPERAELMLRLANLYYELGQASPEAAAEWHSQAIPLYGALAKDYAKWERADEAAFKLASAQAELGQSEAAQRTLHRLVESYPSSAFKAGAYQRIGTYEVDAGRLDAALVFLRKHGAWDSFVGTVLPRLADKYSAQGETDRALAAWRRAVADAPLSPDAPSWQRSVVDGCRSLASKGGCTSEWEALKKLCDPTSAWTQANRQDAAALARAETLLVGAAPP